MGTTRLRRSDRSIRRGQPSAPTPARELYWRHGADRCVPCLGGGYTKNAQGAPRRILGLLPFCLFWPVLSVRLGDPQPVRTSKRRRLVGKECDHGADALLTHQASCSRRAGTLRFASAAWRSGSNPCHSTQIAGYGAGARRPRPEHSVQSPRALDPQVRSRSDRRFSWQRRLLRPARSPSFGASRAVLALRLRREKLSSPRRRDVNLSRQRGQHLFQCPFWSDERLRRRPRGRQQSFHHLLEAAARSRAGTCLGLYACCV